MYSGLLYIRFYRVSILSGISERLQYLIHHLHRQVISTTSSTTSSINAHQYQHGFWCVISITTSARSSRSSCVGIGTTITTTTSTSKQSCGTDCVCPMLMRSGEGISRCWTRCRTVELPISTSTRMMLDLDGSPTSATSTTATCHHHQQD